MLLNINLQMQIVILIEFELLFRNRIISKEKKAIFSYEKWKKIKLIWSIIMPAIQGFNFFFAIYNNSRHWDTHSNSTCQSVLDFYTCFFTLGYIYIDYKFPFRLMFLTINFHLSFLLQFSLLLRIILSLKNRI